MDKLKKTELLFSVSIDNCRVDTFRAGGKGGQNQNKVESGVRVVHEPSGASGEGRDTRDQLQNKINAFKRMAKSDKFQKWARVEASKITTGKSIDELVEEFMKPENIKTEIRNSEGKWEVIDGHDA